MLLPVNCDGAGEVVVGLDEVEVVAELEVVVGAAGGVVCTDEVVEVDEMGAILVAETGAS